MRMINFTSRLEAGKKSQLNFDFVKETKHLFLTQKKIPLLVKLKLHP